MSPEDERGEQEPSSEPVMGLLGHQLARIRRYLAFTGS
jgi:hypothetical protein